jgi:hypothetical protein
MMCPIWIVDSRLRLFHAYARWKGDPTHANKRGVRYRYYVSHAILQNCKAEAGSIGRLPAPEIESLVCDSVRSHLAAMGEAESATALADRELIERHVAHVIVKPETLEVCLVPNLRSQPMAGDKEERNCQKDRTDEQTAHAQEKEHGLLKRRVLILPTGAMASRTSRLMKRFISARGLAIPRICQPPAR